MMSTYFLEILDREGRKEQILPRRTGKGPIDEVEGRGSRAKSLGGDAADPAHAGPQSKGRHRLPGGKYLQNQGLVRSGLKKGSKNKSASKRLLSRINQEFQSRPAYRLQTKIGNCFWLLMGGKSFSSHFLSLQPSPLPSPHP